MLSEKEKLDEELRFLQESFDIGVVTKEEFESGKQRLESRLRDVEEKDAEITEDLKIPVDSNIKAEETAYEDTQDPDKKERTIDIEEAKEEKDDESKDDEEIKFKEIEVTDKKDSQLTLEAKEGEKKQDTAVETGKEYPEIKEEVHVKPEKTEDAKPEEIEIKEEIESKKEDTEIKAETEYLELKPKEVPRPDVKEKAEEIKQEEPKKENDKEVLETEQEDSVPIIGGEAQQEIPEQEIKVNAKVLSFIVIILIASLGSWYFFFAGNSDSEISAEVIFEAAGDNTDFIACNSDSDCVSGGKIGTCSNAGVNDAECTFIDDVEIKLTILNSKDCFNCETGRLLSILSSFYPNLDIRKVNFDTNDGKDLAERYSIDALPAYIFNSSFSEAYNYDKLSSSFVENQGSFVMKKTSANSNYYISRDEIPNKLDLFAKFGQEASSKTEENLQEFLAAFGKNVVFEKHDVNSQIVGELGINTFPAFLINNKIKFGGVQSADKVKENYCKLNTVPECTTGLSKSIV